MSIVRLIMAVVLVLGLVLATHAQEARFNELRTQLDQMSEDAPGLEGNVSLSFGGVSIQEFVRAIAATHDLNLSVEPGIDVTIVNNFANAKVKDVLIYLCRQYNLDMEFTGTIISLKPYVAPIVERKKPEPKKLKINYRKDNDFLSVELKRDTLSRVVQEITRQSLKNIVLSPGIENELVSCYIQNNPFAKTLEMMAFANGLIVEETDANFFVISKADVANNVHVNRPDDKGKRRIRDGVPDGLEITVLENERVTVHASNVPVADVIKAVSSELIKNYYLFSEPTGNTTLFIENASYEDFLMYLLNGSDFTFKIEDNVYLIGERGLERLRTTEIVQLQNRTVESIIDFIPAELKTGVEIQEFLELNSLVLSGSHPRINEIKQYVREIDQVVPVVIIEVMIVEYNKSHTMETGLSLGLGNEPASTTGTYNGSSSGVTSTMNANTINDLINSFNGFGFVNLGKVTQNFYMSIDALETNNVLKKRSTPKLATLNGHEASLSIGETIYYAEQQQTFTGSIQPVQNTVTQFKPLNADFSITIRPIVSGDEQVTLDITVDQSTFKGESEPNAPRGTATLNFKSLIRVHSEEMVLLGGLETKTKDTSGRGLPFIARLPVLSWIFGNKKRTKSKTKLNIFIKPTIIH